MVNADGYSAYLDDVLDEIYPTDATVHPYILHFDDYSVGNYDVSNPMGFESVTNPPPSGNLVMAMGCDYDVQDYKFNMDSITDIRAMPEVEIPACLGAGRRFAHNHVDFNGDMHVVYEDGTLGRWTNLEIGYVKYY